MLIDKSHGEWDENASQVDDVAYTLFLYTYYNFGENFSVPSQKKFMVALYKDSFYEQAFHQIRIEKILKLKSKNEN